jgi:DNA polymerase-3 subunit epsilon
MELMKPDERHVALDTETTGFEPAEGHRIVEIGCVEFMNGLKTGRTFHTLLDPERDVPQEAVDVHGLTEDDLDGQPKFAERCDEMLEFCDGAVVVIHNSAFDLKHLDAELQKAGRPPFSGRFVVKDSLRVARSKYPNRKNDLDSLCTRLGVDNSDRLKEKEGAAAARAGGEADRSGKHGALLDAGLLAEVYMKMAGADGLAHAFVHRQPAASAVVAVVAAAPGPRLREALGGGEPTPEELARHAELLGKIKNPLWNAPQAA